jgi:hypothetical protein
VAAGAPRQRSAAAPPSHRLTCALAGSLGSNIRPGQQKHVALFTRQTRAAGQRLRSAGARASAWDGPKPWRPTQSAEGGATGSSAVQQAGWLHRLRLPVTIMPWDSR